MTSDEFADIAIIWLFDQVMNPEQIQNKNLKDFINQHRQKLRTPLMKYYLDTTSEPRVKYKRIKGVFDGSDESIQQIRIGPSEKIEKVKKAKKEDFGKKAKKALKKIITKEELTSKDRNLLKEICNANHEIFI